MPHISFYACYLLKPNSLPSYTTFSLESTSFPLAQGPCDYPAACYLDSNQLGGSLATMLLLVQQVDPCWFLMLKVSAEYSPQIIMLFLPIHILIPSAQFFINLQQSFHSLLPKGFLL